MTRARTDLGLIDDTAVFDVGTTIVGVYSLRARRYRAYRGDRRIHIAQRLVRTATIVTYGGSIYDLAEIAKLLGLPSRQPTLLGDHIDMQVVCWSSRIRGSNLEGTFARQGDPLPRVSLADEYEASNKRDVAMTLALWRHWKRGTLRIQDGRELAPMRNRS